MISQKDAQRLRGKRRSIISSIDAAGCDVVAVQGIVGSDIGSSQEVLADLAKELSEASSTTWRSYVGLSNNKNANNGVLVGNPDFEMLKIKSYNDMLLPVEEGFRLKNFSRDPFQIDLKIPGKGGSPDRKLSLVTFQFQDSLKPRGSQPEKKLMQMAEGLRQLASNIPSEAQAEDQPIVIVAGDFSKPRTGASARILEGTMRLADFNESGTCKIEGDEKVTCDPKPLHPKMLFGLLSDSLDLGESRAKKGAKLRALFAALDRREEIYMTPPDLHLAWRDHKLPGFYNTGSERIKNGLKSAPLVWVELNW